MSSYMSHLSDNWGEQNCLLGQLQLKLVWNTQPVRLQNSYSWWQQQYCCVMMMLWHENVFHITDPLCGKYTLVEYPSQKSPIMQKFGLFIVSLKGCWTNNQHVSQWLKMPGCLCDITVMLLHSQYHKRPLTHLPLVPHICVNEPGQH